MPSNLSETDFNRIRNLINDLRKVAEPVGTVHGAWSYISDLDNLLTGKPTTRSRPWNEVVDLAVLALDTFKTTTYQPLKGIRNGHTKNVV